MPLVASLPARLHRRVTTISPDARELLVQYDWPGNVRELENSIERAIVMGATETIVPEDLPEAILEAGVAVTGGVGKYHEQVNAAKREAGLVPGRAPLRPGPSCPG